MGAQNSTAARESASLPTVLRGILEAQEDSLYGSDYAQALREIRAGKKRSQWIWYVWPTLRALRPMTSRPQHLLPSSAEVGAYLAHPTLLRRLLEITDVACAHLEGGVPPVVLFGGVGDEDKFYESLTVFSVVAAAELCRERRAETSM
eukprot:SAG11_NODE_480_length_9107_cov_7.433171_4_plen_148_part_00